MGNTICTEQTKTKIKNSSNESNKKSDPPSAPKPSTDIASNDVHLQMMISHNYKYFVKYY